MCMSDYSQNIKVNYLDVSFYALKTCIAFFSCIGFVWGVLAVVPLLCSTEEGTPEL